MVNDPIGDLIARIKNAAMRSRGKVSTPASKMRARVLDVLLDEGYIRGYHLVEKPGAFPEFEIELKYFDGQPVIVEISRVSKPGRRVYSGSKELPNVRNGLGITIVSTPRGVLSDAEARAQNVGGEVLAEVF
jgi:small subunit ribosomal protein S8